MQIPLGGSTHKLLSALRSAEQQVTQPTAQAERATLGAQEGQRVEGRQGRGTQGPKQTSSECYMAAGSETRSHILSEAQIYVEIHPPEESISEQWDKLPFY